MSIVDAFDSSEEKQNKSHIRNLIRLALADGHLEESELLRIHKIARNRGVTREETEHLLANPNSIEFNSPSSKEDRIDRFVNLVRIVLEDGIVSAEEEKLLRRISIGLNITSEQHEIYLVKALEMFKNGKQKDDIIDALMVL